MEHRDPQLSQAYRDAAHPEPAPALDARILDVARQGIVKPAVRPRPAWFGWAVPFSTAAVLVLGVTLLFQIQREAPEVYESPTAMLPTQLDQAAPKSAPADAVMPPTTGAMEQDKPPIAKKQGARLEEKGTAGMPESATSASVVAAPQPFPARAGPPQVLPPSPQPGAKMEIRPEPMTVPTSTQDAAEASANLADRSPDQDAKPPAPAAKAPARATAVGQAMETRNASEPVAESPEQMLETIRRLIREDRLDAARQALDRLRRAYPGFELPEDVKGLSIR